MYSRTLHYPLISFIVIELLLLAYLPTAVKWIDGATSEIEDQLVVIDQQSHLLKALIKYEKYLKARHPLPPPTHF